MQLERILYVEDDADIREVASMALEVVGGFEVLACESGQEALQRVEAFQPQIIVLDVMMPEMDGPATLKCLQADPNTAAIPVIFMTAKVQPGEIAEFLSLGARDVVAKPFDPMTLSDSLRRIWKRIEDTAA